MTGYEGPNLSDDERIVLVRLKDAWNAFIDLSSRTSNDDAEFLHGIHYLECMIALRVARRVDPDMWNK